ncbi:MAG: flippase [Niallia nealsonii]|nr:flippase [Niallia nealsonii]
MLMYKFQKKMKNLNKNVLKNIIWLFSEKVLKMVLNFFVFALIARHLKPEEFGILNSAIALVFIITSLLDLGLSGLVVKELIKNEKKTDLILGTTYYLKRYASIFGFIVLLISMFFLSTWEIRLVTLFVGISLLFRPLEVIDIYNQAKVISKNTVLARNIALVIVSIVQLALIIFDYGLFYFAFTQSLEVIISVILLRYYYKKDNKISNWKFNFEVAKSLLRRSWPLILSSIAAVLYLKVDQLMLQRMIGSREVGIYSAASRISEVWYFIPNALVASIFPKMVGLRNDEKKFNSYLQTTYNFLFILAFILSLIITFFSPFIIKTAFGTDYSDASTILSIHIWTSCFVFMRALLSKWLIIEEKLVFSLVSHGLGAVFNIVLNYIFIPYYGGIGSAVSTFIAYSISTYLFCFLNKETRVAGNMMTKAMFSPFIYILRKKEGSRYEGKN